MKKVLLLVVFYIPILIQAQRNYTSAEISRLADLGKIWGILHNFHPSMARDIVSTDSLVSDVAESLANDPSSANFRACLEKMLAKLKDPITHVVTDKQVPVKLFTDNDSLPSYRLLADSILYVAFPTSFASNEAVSKLSWLQLQEFEKYKGLVLDLRNAKQIDDDYPFTKGFGDAILRKGVNKPLQIPVHLFRYQAGFIDQRNTSLEGGVYIAGWQTKSSGTIRPAARPAQWNGRMVVVVNRFSSSQLMEWLLALQSAGYCKIIFDGDAVDYLNSTAWDYYTAADSLHLKLRIFDYLDVNGKIIRDPDLFINGISDENIFLEKCRILAITSTKNNPENIHSLAYRHPFPNNENSGFAPIGQRLFGLYNYWNAINYFNPNKHLLKQPWDSVLVEFIPRFINANDTTSYYFTIADMVSRIHDSHGFLNLLNMKTVAERYWYTVPLSAMKIGTKYYIVSIGKDSTQNINAFQLWDEIIAIDSVPINIYKEKFRSRFAASNDWTFERDVRRYLLSGAKNSVLQLTIMRNGKITKLNALRTQPAYLSDYDLVSFNDNHKDIEILKGNIGYVNMGLLTIGRIDKMFDTLMDTKAIIFDIRNYPKGTVFDIVPRLTDHDSVAVKFGIPYVTYKSIYEPLISKNSDYFIVNADKTKPYYKGKIIILCNAITQSHAEYTIMLFQGAAGKRVTVIGSATAGADGNVTAVKLPGGYSTYFSGLEVLYPDGSQTQQTGIRINIKVEPTLAGLRASKDEVLQKAIQFIESGK
ncbi:MAG TPA: S41 family peptidase [Chitinophagaceae bacterium]|jgi:C-terminal processing protease CtpA/Prc|nr:S41 family peptidase [Chitinophagaceae bacterium]